MNLFTSACEQDGEGQPPPTWLLWMNSTLFSSTPSVLLSWKFSLCALIQAEPSAFSGPFKPSPSPHTCRQAIKQANISPLFCHHFNIFIALEMLWNLSLALATECNLPSSAQLRSSLGTAFWAHSLPRGLWAPWKQGLSSLDLYTGRRLRKKKKKNARSQVPGREKEEEEEGKFLKCSLWDQADVTPHQVQQQKLNHMWATPDCGEEERKNRVTVAWWPGCSVWGGGKKYSCDRDISALLREGREK